MNLWWRVSCIFIRNMGNWRFVLYQMGSKVIEKHVMFLWLALWDSMHSIQHDKSIFILYQHLWGYIPHKSKTNKKEEFWGFVCLFVCLFSYASLTDRKLCLWRKASIYSFHYWLSLKVIGVCLGFSHTQPLALNGLKANLTTQHTSRTEVLLLEV